MSRQEESRPPYHNHMNRFEGPNDYPPDHRHKRREPRRSGANAHEQTPYDRPVRSDRRPRRPEELDPDRRPRRPEEPYYEPEHYPPPHEYHPHHHEMTYPPHFAPPEHMHPMHHPEYPHDPYLEPHYMPSEMMIRPDQRLSHYPRDPLSYPREHLQPPREPLPHHDRDYSPSRAQPHSSHSRPSMSRDGRPNGRSPPRHPRRARPSEGYTRRPDHPPHSASPEETLYPPRHHQHAHHHGMEPMPEPIEPPAPTKERRDSRRGDRVDRGSKGQRYSRSSRDHSPPEQMFDPSINPHDPNHSSPPRHQSIIHSINPAHDAPPKYAKPPKPAVNEMPLIRLSMPSGHAPVTHPVTGANLPRKRRSDGFLSDRQSAGSPSDRSRVSKRSRYENNHSPPQPTKCAFVHLVMKGDSYIPGALVSAYSIRITNTVHSLVCMVTPDVSEEGRERLRIVFDEVVEVPYISAHVGALKTQKQAKMYESWVDVAFTKWNILTLLDYAKVMFIDADKIILANIDHLFLLNAPAATFSSPWSQPFVKRSHKKNSGPGLVNPYITLEHGDQVQPHMIEQGLTKNSFVLIGTMVLLEPSQHDFDTYLSMLARSTPDRPFGFPPCHSMMDEQSLTVLYDRELRRPFTFIHQRYNFISWHREWLDEQDLPYVYHYFSTKPWILKRDSFIDCETWWSLAECLLHDTSRYSEQALKCIIGCFDAEQLNVKGQEGCAWCYASELEEPIWKSHSVFDHQGNIACPELQRREQQKEIIQ